MSTAQGYWVKPGFPERDMYLPLDAPGALRWYLNTLYRTPSAYRWLLGLVLRALTLTGLGLGRLAPCFAITAIRGRALRPSIVAAARHLDGELADSIDPLFLAQGRAEWSRVAVMLFDREGSPRAVLKCARRPAFNLPVESEHRFLNEVGTSLPPALRPSVPESSLFQWNGLAVSRQTCVPGATLTSRAGRGGAQAREDFVAATRWLADFHDATRIEHAPARPWLARHLAGGLCREYVKTFGTTAAEQRLFAALEANLGSLESARLPIVWQHTDFGPWNVHRDRERISVIDWEVARRGPALADMVYFAAHWSMTTLGLATDDERCRHLAGLFCRGESRTNAGTVAREGVARYMLRLGITPALLPFLVVYTFVEQALERARRVDALGQAGAGNDPENPYVLYVRTIADHSAALFPLEVSHAA